MLYNLEKSVLSTLRLFVFLSHFNPTVLIKKNDKTDILLSPLLS